MQEVYLIGQVVRLWHSYGPKLGAAINLSALLNGWSAPWVHWFAADVPKSLGGKPKNKRFGKVHGCFAALLQVAKK
jgi:hypothetical protein